MEQQDIEGGLEVMEADLAETENSIYHLVRSNVELAQVHYTYVNIVCCTAALPELYIARFQAYAPGDGLRQLSLELLVVPAGPTGRSVLLLYGYM